MHFHTFDNIKYPLRCLIHAHSQFMLRFYFTQIVVKSSSLLQFQDKWKDDGKKEKTNRIAAQRSSREKVKSFPTSNLLYLALSSTDLNGSAWLVLRCTKGLFSDGFSPLPALFASRSSQRATNSGVLCVCRLHSPNRRNATYLNDKILFVVWNLYSMHRYFYV